MPVSAAYVLDSVDLGSGEFISQINSLQYSPEVVTSLLRAAGSPAPAFRSVAGVSPGIPFQSPQLGTLLGALSTGFAWQDLSADNTDVQWRQITPNSDRASRAGSTNKRMRIADAVLLWNGLSAAHRGTATGDFRVQTVYDGTNNPVVPAGSVALSGSPTANEAYGLGPIVINSTALGGEQDLSLNNNLNIKRLSGGSEVYDTMVAIEDYNTVVEISNIEDDEFEDIPPTGLAITGFAFYLRKKTKNGTYVADATEQHISFTSTSGMVYFISGDGGENQHATDRLRVELDNLTIDTTAALP